MTPRNQSVSFWRSDTVRAVLATTIIAVITALLVDHWTHLGPIPLIVLGLICPVTHLLVCHRRHKEGDGGHNNG